MATMDLVPATPAVAPSYELITLPPSDLIRDQLREVRRFQAVVKELFVENHDYGVIPGTGNKPTLLKPGAEKLIKLLGLSDTYEFAEKVEDWERPFFSFTVLCRLRSMTTGVVVAEGLGNCNSYESKYRFRWAWPNELTEDEKAGLKFRTTKNGGKQYRVENDDIFSLVNTLIKMACKRAQMAAALSAGRLSEVFTQDLEDLADNGVIDQETASRPQPQQRQAPQNGNGAAPRRPTNVETVNAEDPRWQYWIVLSGVASQVGIKLPSITVPVPAPALASATASLKRAILDKHGEIPAGDPDGETPIPPPGASAPEQEEIDF
jgi:hypothetical protein